MKILSDEQAEYAAQALDNEPEQTTEIRYRDPVKDLGFAMIPHAIGLDAELSDGAYRTYGLLMYHWQNKHRAWPRVDTLAGERGVGEATIERHLAELVKVGLITRQRRMGQASNTFLEDLPERYASISNQVLEERARKKLEEKGYVGIKNDAKFNSKVMPHKNNNEEEQYIPDMPKSISGVSPKKEPETRVSIEETEREDRLKKPTNHSVFKIGHALAEVCKQKLSLSQKKFLMAASKLVRADPNVTPDQIRLYYGRDSWWYRKDWRGQNGSPPNIATINETWGKWESEEIETCDISKYESPSNL